jgi:2-oxoglutarate/2-oxoacid ferredoxin oxidoreductase subunit beta
VMFNNQIYGLTKGQYSPTSEVGKITKSSPFGSLDYPFNPLAVALGAEASFVARTHDMDRKHMMDVLKRAHFHKGASFVEVYQNCNVFNDGAFDVIRDKQQGAHNQIRLVDGEPIVFDEGTRCVRVGENGRLEISTVEASDPASIVTHDVHGRPSLAFALAHLSHGPTEPTCIGVFHEEERPAYGEAVRSQVDRAVERLGPGDLKALLHGGDTWTVG